MGPSSDGQPGSAGLAGRGLLGYPLLIQDTEISMVWMSGCLDVSARFLFSALTLRVFFVTRFFSVQEVTMPTKLELLLEKEAQLKAQIQQAKAAERTLEKKRDTRRKILIGAAVLARVERGEWPQRDLSMMMDGFLTRPHERELFDLDGDEGAGDDLRADDLGAVGKPAWDEVEADAFKDNGATTKQAGKGRLKVLPETPVDINDEFNL
jgi:hypothetical protein